MAQVYLVGVPPQYPCRCWLVGTESRKLRSGEIVDAPVLDDSKAKLCDLDYAIEAKRFWKEKLSLTLHISAEKYGQFIAEDLSDPAVETTNHEIRFVPLTGGNVDGKGYFAKYNPQLRRWYIRAIDIPSMAVEHAAKETLWADSPEGVVSKVLEHWGLHIAVPFDDPAAIEKARQEQEKAQQAAQHVRIAGLRPGDR
jgi:hypothetical protein